MRLPSLSSTLLLTASSAQALDVFRIPQVEQLVKQALKPFEHYLHYHGPPEGVQHKEWHHHPVSTKNPQESSYWLADIAHQGVAAFNPDPSNYTVFRNVKDYGANGKVP